MPGGMGRVTIAMVICLCVGKAGDSHAIFGKLPEEGTLYEEGTILFMIIGNGKTLCTCGCEAQGDRMNFASEGPDDRIQRNICPGENVVNQEIALLHFRDHIGIQFFTEVNAILHELGHVEED